MALIKINNRSTKDDAVHGRRNLVINGSMNVAQRATSDTSISSDGYYTCDRWQYQRVGASPSGTIDMERLKEAPTGTGLTNCLRVEVNTSDATIGSDEAYTIKQLIEGRNGRHIMYGTSDAKTLALTFWVRSSITGNFGFVMRYTQGSGTYTWTKEYNINTADTWEKKTIIIPSQTDAGAYTSSPDTEIFQLRWMLATGSGMTNTSEETWAAENKWGISDQTNFFATSGNTWDITGVQLEVGDQPSSFEHISYGEELTLCQRYFQKAYYKLRYGTSSAGVTSSVTRSVNFGTTMRGSPTIDSTTDITTGTNVTISSVVGYEQGLEVTASSSGGYNNWVTGNFLAHAEL